jgi:hydrogenase/urease accessory protein HupE
MRSRLVWMPAALLLWASCPGQASAHLVNSGVGPFYDGVAHFFLSPEDILAVVALALLAGLGSKECGCSVLLALPAAWLGGAVAGRMSPLAAGLPILSAALLIALGVLVASDRRLPRRLIAGFALTVGLVHGFFNGAALAGVNSGSVAIGGIVCAVFVVAALVAGQVVSLRKEWARIAVRVAGSWIGAIGLLMLGWAAH